MLGGSKKPPPARARAAKSACVQRASAKGRKSEWRAVYKELKGSVRKCLLAGEVAQRRGMLSLLFLKVRAVSNVYETVRVCKKLPC